MSAREEAAKRVAEFVRQYKLGKAPRGGLDPTVITGVNTDVDAEMAELLVADLAELTKPITSVYVITLRFSNQHSTSQKDQVLGVRLSVEDAAAKIQEHIRTMGTRLDAWITHRADGLLATNGCWELVATEWDPRT